MLHDSSVWVDPSEGGDRGSGPPPSEIKIGFIRNTGLNLPKNHKATKPAFNGGPSSACQRNAIKMAFRWQADDGPPLKWRFAGGPMMAHL